MKKISLIIAFSLLSTLSSPYAYSKEYKAVDEFTKNSFSVDSAKFLKNESLSKAEFDFSEKDLLKVLINTREYYKKFSDIDPVIKRTGFLESADISLEDVLKTIELKKM